MAGDHILQVLHLDMLGQLNRQRGIGQITARVEQCCMPLVDDDELVAFDPFSGNHAGKQQAVVIILAVQRGDATGSGHNRCSAG